MDVKTYININIYLNLSGRTRVLFSLNLGRDEKKSIIFCRWVGR